MKIFSLFRCVSLQSVLGVAVGVLLLVTGQAAHAASTWNPTLLVNTESFQTIDEGDSTTDIEIRFGQTLQEKLIYDRTNNRFKFTRGIFVSGGITGTGALNMSGNLLTNSDITLNSDRGAADAVLTFGNATTNQTIKFLTGTQRFQFSTKLSVPANISGASLNVDGLAELSGNLSVSGSTLLRGATTINGATKVRGNLSGASLNVDGGAFLFGTLSVSGATLIRGATTINANTRVRGFLSGSTLRVDGNAAVGSLTSSGAIRAHGALSGQTLEVDGNVKLHGVTYNFSTTQGSANTFLKNDGAGNLTWSTTSTGNSSGSIVSLHPGYNGATYYSSGAVAVGTLVSSYDSTNKENFYRWTTSKSALNDYWVGVRVKVPKNFNNFTASGITLKIRTTSTSSSSNYITFRLLDTTGAAVAVTNNANLVSTVASTWRTNTITGLGGGTYTAGGYITVLLKLAATTGNNTDIGTIDFNWSTTTP